MATFRIHEDIENTTQIKENVGHTKNLARTKEQRTTFAVLNNVALSTRAHAQKTVQQDAKALFNAKANNKINNENEIPRQILVASKKMVEPKLFAPVDFKSFSVYEDGAECKKDDEEVPNMSTLRNPLQELRNDSILGTPMSVGDLMSPMSVDKSLVLDTINNKSTVCTKSERERFFDVEEYQQDIVEYLKESEIKHPPKFGYMKKQPDINHSMRTILVDWLVEVCEEYRLQSETLCLAVSYIDRFLSVMSVVRAKLQLVGTAAMFIAAKYEEIYPPDVGEFVYITDHTYTKKQVLRMEQLILKVLTFDLSVPTTYTYNNLYSIMNVIPDKIKFLATYVCELSLLEADPFLQYMPSKLSAASLALARYTLDYPIWSKRLEDITGYSVESLQEIIMHLSSAHHAAVNSPQQAIQDKYKTNKYAEVSTLNPVHLDEETFAIAVAELQKAEEKAATTEHNNENVRKMISSLIFV